jgi:hypothetical protein
VTNSEESRPRGPLFPDVSSYYHVLFVVGVEELGELLSMVEFIVSGSSWIPETEWPEGRRHWIQDYDEFVSALGCADPLMDASKAESNLNIRLARTRDIFSPVPKERGLVYLESVEPYAELHVAGAVTTEPEKLALNILSSDGGALGLRLKYAKHCTYDSEGHAVRHSTETFPNFELYQKLETWVRSHTKPCRFHTTTHGVKASKLRASLEGREILRKHAWLRSRGIELA